MGATLFVTQISVCKSMLLFSKATIEMNLVALQSDEDTAEMEENLKVETPGKLKPLQMLLRIRKDRFAAELDQIILIV